MSSEKLIIIGKFGKTFGVKGFIRVNSFTDPQANILNYKIWYVSENSGWQKLIIEEKKVQGNGILVKLANCNSLEEAALYVNKEIAVAKQELPKLPKGEYYWNELEGLRVVDKAGKEFGKVAYLFATGANDVLLVKNHHKQYLIPYTENTIVKVDLDKALIVVDWEFEEH